MDNTFNGFDSSIIKGPMPGEVLREARRARDLSMKYIANQLRLSIDIVDALENDDYKNLPVAAFVQGYIRNYAALLGLNADPLITQYTLRKEEETTFKAKKKRKLKKGKSSKNHVLPVRIFSYVISLGLIIAAMALIYNSKPKEDEDILLADETIQVASKILSAKKHGPISVDELDFVGSVSKLAMSEVATKKSAIKVNKLDTLSIKFNKSSYIVVLDANNKQLLKERGVQGYRAKVTGRAPFRVKLKQPKNIIVKLNGRLVKHLKRSHSKTGHKGGARTIIVQKQRPLSKNPRLNAKADNSKLRKRKRARN